MMVRIAEDREAPIRELLKRFSGFELDLMLDHESLMKGPREVREAADIRLTVSCLCNGDRSRDVAIASLDERDFVELDALAEGEGILILVDGSPCSLVQLASDAVPYPAIAPALVMLGNCREPVSPVSGWSRVCILYDDVRTDLADLEVDDALCSFEARFCTKLNDLSAFEKACRLKSIALEHCDHHMTVDALVSLTSLTSLALEFCDLTSLDALARLTSLTSLTLAGCFNLTSVDGLAGLTSLTYLNLSWCNSLTCVDALADLKSLTSLSLCGCDSIASLDTLAGLTSLTSLNLSRCEGLASLDALARLTSLTSLNLTECNSLTSLDALAGLTSLTSLNLSRCEGLASLDALEGMASLTYLNLSWCNSLTCVDALADLKSLTCLNLRGCDSLASLDTLAGLTSLTSLNLSWCEGFNSVDFLAGLTSLTFLGLSAWGSLTSVDVLAGLTSLVWLDLNNCESLKRVDGLADLTSLTSLNLENCRLLTHLLPLAGHPRLETICLNGCRAIRDIDVLASCPAIRELEYDTDPPAAAAVLAGTAVLRRDPSWFVSEEDRIPDLLQAVRLSRDPDLLVPRLARGFAMGTGGPWSTSALCDLVKAARERGEVSTAVWHEVLGRCLELGDAACRLHFEAAVEGLDPVADRGRILEPWLETLSRMPERAHTWAIGLAERILAALKDDRISRELAPAICLFYARMGRDSDVQTWLKRATQAETPVWRDRSLLALARWDLERNAPSDARRKIGSVETESLRDEGRAALALALASRAPVEAGQELSAVASDVQRAVLALELSAVPEFTRELANVYEILLAVESRPDALADLLQQLSIAYPESPLVAELARWLSPPDAGAGLTESIRGTMDAIAAGDFISGRGLNRYRALAGRLAEDPLFRNAFVRRACAREIVAAGFVPAEDLPALLDHIAPSGIGPETGEASP